MNKGAWLNLVLFVTPLIAADDARQIVAEAQKRSRAESQHYQGVLQVVDSRGKISDKQWEYDRIGSHGNSKAIIRFTSPPEVKGVALLIFNHPDKASDQWMWTPAINRERRIAKQDRRTRFFGTDFSFEDLEERDLDQYEYTLNGEESIDGESCWKIESGPRESKSSQYSRSLLWIQKRTYSFARIENYSDGQLIRRLNYKDIANIQGIWTARRLEMEDVTRNSKTILKLDSLKYNVPLKSEQFTLQALRRS
jgi:hypothetical protein